MITVLADQHIPFLDEYLGGKASIITFDPARGMPVRGISPDAILVRTVTPINAATLRGDLTKSLRFVGAASAGSDHIDTSFLEKTGVQFGSSAGANATAVAEYVVTVALHWISANKISGLYKKVGIVGAGHTGMAVAHLFEKLGFQPVLHDPPRELRDPDFTSAPLKEVLSCAVLTLHVPLIEPKYALRKEWSTLKWLDADKLKKCRTQLVINASRGGVVDELALKNAFLSAEITDYVMDVWENEPEIASAMLQDAWLATPHIAGYSIQAKKNITQNIAAKMFDVLEPEKPNGSLKSDNYENSLNQANNESKSGAWELQLPPKFPAKLTLHQALEYLHPMFSLSKSLKSIALEDPDVIRSVFLDLRTNRPLRNEYPFTDVPKSLMEQFPEIQTLCSQ